MSPVFLILLGIVAGVDDTATKQVQPKGVRVAVVNIGVVFNKYERALAFKQELEETLRPYKQKAKKLQDDIKTWDNALKNGDTAIEAVEHFKNRIRDNKRHLEDMGRQISKLLGKKQEENLVILWKEVQAEIKAVADDQGIDIVFGYGDPIDKEMLDLFPDVNRKMQAMDAGSTVPLFVGSKMDISATVVRNLNARIHRDDDDEDIPLKGKRGSKKEETRGGTDRIAVVNIGHVFTGYHRANRFKAELANTLKPYKDQAAKITKNIKKWEAAVSNEDFIDFSKEEYQEKIIHAKRQLEDMGAEITKLLGKKQEENLVTLWKEVQDGIKTYADQNGIDIVFGYGDPMEKELLDRFPNVNRKMQAMDLGSTVPLFVASRREIAPGVVELLNKRYREKDHGEPAEDDPR